MITITLPDKSTRQFDTSINIIDIAKAISISLAKTTIAGYVDDVLRDANYLITTDSTLRIITTQDQASLEILRHSTAHLLAQAVKDLYPQAQVTIGPVITDGFYYDFKLDHHFTTDDLLLIEERMHKLANQNFTITRQEVSQDTAINYFQSINEIYKIAIIKKINAAEQLSLYQQGNFTDLCRGPHLINTTRIKFFKLTKVSGAYWLGDAKNEMLQRIYGTAWYTKEELDQYLYMLEEVAKRDHRKIGKELDLFHLQDEAPGMVFWHAKGWQLWQTIEQYMRSMYLQYGYQEVKTPQIVDRSLWEKSGHWDKFKADMFSLQANDKDYAIKPMNCPCHVQIFKHKLTSYRELPIRIAEFGSCHRNEASGALHGIMRTRNFTQDDGHIFCTEEQIQEEVMNFIDMLFAVYKQFGLDDNIAVKLSTRPKQRIGSDEAWDKAENALAMALDTKKLQWQILQGEGAFYGPKIEFEIKDSINRSWTTGSIQLDFSMPEALGASYIDSNDLRQTPVMLHRAICGSLERFMGILLEHYAGKLPFWLAPVQIVILNISMKQIEYTNRVFRQLLAYNYRCIIDISNEKISYKIRMHTLQKIPYLLIIGDKELQSDTITIRQCDGTDVGSMSIEDFVLRLK